MAVTFGTSANNNITGTSGNDIIYGLGGNDVITAGAGNDNAYGGLGNDSLDGYDGDDNLDGAEGNDTLFGGEGNDYLFGWNNNDILIGGHNNDSLYGGDGNDRLVGFGGRDDRYEGYADFDDDRLEGGAGNDTLIGGYGNDTLIGGTGSDFFDYDFWTGGYHGADGEGIDTITDFSVANDTIRVSGNYSSWNGSGDLVEDAFITAQQFTLGSSATTAQHRFIYNSTTGGFFFDKDGTGDNAQEQLAILPTNLAMTNLDIFITIGLG